ncbi:hypothetical protein [Pedobacter sp. Leaf176]|uniref:hypothetical protein n=1 Tax=Pedobacter sp. Leaf176 TaxID=1736286 RepID=UPI0006F78FDD|nr:hypothetical protein [Pedobacter sp. Leaf176]KQR70900.1 hypothetical protein ASF92_05695 [Pedobacter sp. Leaf176]
MRKKILVLLIAFPALSYGQTQSRSDAGLQGNAGATSGFFETNSPVNYPFGATAWWHLLDVRHSNTVVNYAMQFSGSFFDQNLYFRKTNNSAAQSWSRILLETDGKVGVNTVNPTGSLQVNGNTNGGQLVISRDHLGGGEGPGMVFKNVINNSVQEQIGGIEAKLLSGAVGQVAGFLNFFTVINSTKINAMTLSAGGNVGIGTDNPTEKLSVNGKIRAHEIKVEMANWPDYVFEQDYKILGLQELDAYIKVNKHLPDMPSAKEAELNGIELGGMNKLSLKKVEELTLHLIEKDTQIKKVLQRLEALEAGKK